MPIKDNRIFNLSSLLIMCIVKVVMSLVTSLMKMFFVWVLGIIFGMVSTSYETSHDGHNLEEVYWETQVTFHPASQPARYPPIHTSIQPDMQMKACSNPFVWLAMQ